MQVLVQRVEKAHCTVEDETVGSIEYGYLLYVSFHKNDTEKQIPEMAYKIARLRIFSDDAGKMNRALLDQENPQVLSISQFTLEAQTQKGHRPSFTEALTPTKAEHYFHYFNDCLKREGIHVETGRFGEHMKIISINDGPVTLLIKRDEHRKD